MIRPSPELLAVSRRWYDAIRDRRVREMQNLLSDREYLRFIGTSDGENWSGPAVREGIGGFFGVVPANLSHEEIFSEAYENGETGWSCFTYEIVFANRPDKAFRFRITLIFALEDGAWKIVHRHGSVPVPNMEVLGTEQTAIAELVEAARKGFALHQRQGFASIMFTDIVNSSRLASVMGDRLWSAEVARHFDDLRGIIEGAGGQFVKSLGDGTMSSFPSPGQALHAAGAVMCATDASDGPAIKLRIGVHTGDVVQTAEDFFGTVVNKAARIAAMAGPGEIRVSGVTRDMVAGEGAFAFADPMTLPLKGIEGDHLVCRLEWRDGRQGRAAQKTKSDAS